MSSGYNVLIVDDNSDLRLDLKDILNLEGYEVQTAADGREALSILETHSIDLIISDYEMPHMNGFTLLNTVRADKKTVLMPFILISGGTPPTTENDPEFRFLRKPIEIEKLTSLMNTLLSSSSRTNGQRVAD